LATVKVLERLGVSVEFDERQTCCGQLAFNSGHVREARAVGRQFIDVFAESETIVVPSGSCCSMIKCHIPHLFAEGSQERADAKQVASRTYEFSDFLVSVLGVTETGATFPEKVTFHDSCHQLRELGVSRQPRQLIRTVKGIEFIEMENSQRCCGFGGTFSVKFADVSAAIGMDKLGWIRESGADYVVLNDVSCLMHIDGLLRRHNVPVQTMHLAELLAK
jgi:L-lactate dehydrogenase complex protein LldE